MAYPLSFSSSSQKVVYSSIAFASASRSFWTFAQLSRWHTPCLSAHRHKRLCTPPLPLLRHQDLSGPSPSCLDGIPLVFQLIVTKGCVLLHCLCFGIKIFLDLRPAVSMAYPLSFSSSSQKVVYSSIAF